MIRKFTADTRSLLLVAFLALNVGVSCSSKEEGPADVEPTERECEEDEQGEPASAAALTAEPSTGYVCPVEDQDWYSLTIPAGDQLVSVSLGIDVPLSPVEITYAIFSKNASGEPDAAVAQPPPDSVKIGAQLSLAHCIPPGDYLMVVRDQGDDGFDNRNAYSLAVTSQPDPDMSEPNADAATATALTSGTPQTGYVACRQDEDYYTITVPDDNRLSVTLTSPIAQYEPRVQVLTATGELIRAEENPRGPMEATDISFSQVLPGAGQYLIVVSDNDNENADPSVPYTLTVDTILDIDPNEPNDSPATATPLSGTPAACGANWSQTFTSTGTIGSEGDDDWFQLPVTGCNPGIVEATVEFDTAGLSAQQQWEFNTQVQAAVTVVRAHQQSACAEDNDCTTLVAACESPLDCAGIGDVCLPGQELCAGAVVCLPGGLCGANQMQRSYRCPPTSPECQPGNGAPPANVASLAAPIFNTSATWIRVTDFQGNGSAPERTYTLTVRVRGETDTNEPSNLPLGEILPQYERGDLFSAARPITVRDCTAGDCCGAGNGISGTISYDNDVDYYTYPHPCPGQDCTLRMVWSTEAGPVDIGINVYRAGGGSWVPAREPNQQENQAADNGSTGGIAGANECYYAFQGHNNGYVVEVRDVQDVFSDEVNVRPDSREWSPDQGYTFCVEKVSNVCEEPPCQIYPNGCGPPM